MEQFGMILAAEPSLEQGDDSTHRRLFPIVRQNPSDCFNQTSSQMKQFVRIVPLEVLRTIFEPHQAKFVNKCFHHSDRIWRP